MSDTGLSSSATTFWLGHLVSFAVATLGGRPWSWRRTVSVGIGALAASVPVTVFARGPSCVDIRGVLLGGCATPLSVCCSDRGGGCRVFRVFCSRQCDVPADPASDKLAEPAWLDQLPAHLGRDLDICSRRRITIFRVVTERGETLIRAGYGRGREARSATYGIRIHRSWWVARGGGPTPIDTAKALRSYHPEERDGTAGRSEPIADRHETPLHDGSAIARRNSTSVDMC